MRFILKITCFTILVCICNPVGVSAVEPEIAEFLSGFKAVRVANNIAYCATDGGLRIYDIQNRTSPRVLSNIIVSESANIDLEIAGNHAYVLSGFIFLEQSYVTVINISDPSNPAIVSRFSNLEDAQVTDLLIQDSALIVANGEHIDFLNISDPANLKRISRIKITSFEGSVRALAVHEKTLFAVWENFGDSALDAVDISDIRRPKKITTYYYPRLNGFQRPSGFLTISGSTVYVSVPTLGLLIFDATKPQFLVPVTSLEGDAFFSIDAIYAEGTSLFVNFNDFEKQEIAVFDLANPASPSLIRRSTEPTVSVIGMDFDATSAEAYLGLNSSKGSGLGIFQLLQQGELSLISNDTVPVSTDVATSNTNIFVSVSDGLISAKATNNKLEVIGKLTLPNQTGSIKVVSGRAYVTTSDNSQHSFLNIIDIENPAQMKLLGKFRLKNVPGYVAQETFDVEESRVYSAGNKGLSIIDVSNPANPRQIGFFPITETFGPGVVEVQNGIAFVGTSHFQTEGELTLRVMVLSIVDVRNAQSPKLIARKTIAPATVLTDIAFRDGYLYMMFAGLGGDLLPVGDGQLAIVDVRTVTKPEVLFSGYTRKRGTGYAEEIAFRDNFAFIADGLEGVTILNLANKTRPEIIGTLATPGNARGISIDASGLIHLTDNTSYMVFTWP